MDQQKIPISSLYFFMNHFLFYLDFLIIKYQQDKSGPMFQKLKLSPYKSQQYKQLEHSKQDFVRKIQIVFVFFCGKGSKYNYQELQEKYFMEMATELFHIAGKDQQFNRKTSKWTKVATLYYTKGRKNPLNSTQFLELLPGLAKLIFGSEESPRKYIDHQQQQKSMKSLLILFDKLHHHIREQQMQRKGIQCEQLLQDTKEFLFKLKDSFAKLYKIYFDSENSIRDKEKDYFYKSFEGLLELMKDFEVYPKIISASQLYFVYNQVMNDQENFDLSLLSPSLYTKIAFPRLGQHFTLTKFVYSLILASHLCMGKLKRTEFQEIYFSQLHIAQKESVKLLLEYMQTMRSTRQKSCRFTTQRFSLIVYQEYSEYISKKQQIRSSPVKSKVSPNLSESKRSFYDILNKLDI